MNDLISRQDAIDAVTKRIEISECGESVDHNKVIADIKSLPSADVVEVVHGEWISWYVDVKHGNCEEYIPHTACCACGTEIDPYHKDAYKWCPFCGAKMDGEHGKKN